MPTTPRIRTAAVITLSLVLAVSTVPSNACMRPTIDERAVQWSDAIVEAKLASIGPEIKLGEVQERRGALGTLGTANITYSYRLYTFDVIKTLDGAIKPGEKLPIIRIFSRTEEPAVANATAGPAPASSDPCSQLLVQGNVGKEFVVLTRLLSQFKAIVPAGVKIPDVKGAMWIVHVAAKDSLQPAAMDQLTSTITAVHDTERQIDPARVDRLIGQIEYAQNDDRAGPSIRALEHLGPKVIPTVQTAAMKGNGQPRTRLLQVVSDLTPTEPIMLVEKIPTSEK
jgi:hypothetical protein